MALNYDTITALVNAKYVPIIQDNIFLKKSYLLNRLKTGRKTYNERMIVQDLEYGKSPTTTFLQKYGTITLADSELITAAEFTPAMLTDALVITKEDELRCRSSLAIKKLLDVKMKNLTRSMEDYLATHIWQRGTTVTTGEWNHLDFLVNASAMTVGGIATSDASWWVSKEFDVDDCSDADTAANLIDSSKDCYLVKLLQRGIALSTVQDGSNPDFIVMPQYLFDLLEIINETKKRFGVDDKIAKMGFTNLTFRGIPIVPDNYMVAAQTGDADGRIYFLKLEYLYMYLNSGAAFTFDKFVQQPNSNVRSSLVNAYGNLAISNRRAQVVIKNILSPQAYVDAA